MTEPNRFEPDFLADQPPPAAGQPMPQYPAPYPQQYAMPYAPPVAPQANWRPNANAYKRAFAVAGVCLLAWFVGIAVAAGGPPTSGYAIGLVLAKMGIPLAIAAGITGATAKAKPRPWAWWKYAGMVILIHLAIMIVLAMGELGRNLP